MKNQEKRYSIKNTLLFLTVSACILSIAACSDKIEFNTSSIVPAARGDVQVKKDANNNYKIEIDVADLAESTRLTPPKNTYVVWLMTSNETAKNSGQLQIKNLKASLNTISSTKPVKVFITTEDDPAVQFPSGVTVLSTVQF